MDLYVCRTLAIVVNGYKPELNSGKVQNMQNVYDIDTRSATIVAVVTTFFKVAWS